MFKHKNDVYVRVTPKEYRLICQSLIALRNTLQSQGRYTDPIDEMLEKRHEHYAEAEIHEEKSVKFKAATEKPAPGAPNRADYTAVLV